MSINKSLYYIDTSYTRKVAYFRENIAFAEQWNVMPPVSLSTTYGSLAYNLLFMRDFDGALRAADTGLKIHRDNTWIVTNKVLAHLFRKEFAVSESLYKEYRDKPWTLNSQFKTFKDAFRSDLERLEAAKVISGSDKAIQDEVARIRRDILQ